MVARTCLVAVVFTSLCCTAGEARSSVIVQLHDIDSGLTSPQGNYRWMDAADQLYSAAYRESYEYTQATVTVELFLGAETLHGTLTATDLKPNFAYQLKLNGKTDIDPAANERIGLTGRWWQEEWDGQAWVNGRNLNNKGDGSSPNPNDLVYFARRDIPDATSPTGRQYRYTAYLVFDYFITDDGGNASVSFEADDSYHVLWKTAQRGRTDLDGALKSRTFAVTLPDPADAYDAAYPQTAVEIFGEWERLPCGAVTLPPGAYDAQIMLTEESFHGGGLAGGWAAAMGADVSFAVIPPTGDMDASGAVNNDDITPFVLALTDRATYEATYPGIDPDVVGDIDGSGALNNNDITPFVTLLTTGSYPQAIPEPATIGLLALGGLALLRRRSR